jgi:sugar O-acyltransferase (sialic acid O-acetyltransferase NeuD family)
MPDLIQILVPLVNPNENESLLARLAVKEGQQVKKGELLAVFETTKSTFELLSESSGYVLSIRASEGDLLKTGELLCYLAERADQVLPKSAEPETPKPAAQTAGDLRITQPALVYAQSNAIDLSVFPVGQLITEKMVKEFSTASLPEIDPAVLIIYGGGGHAKSLIDLIRAEEKYRIHCILDDGIAAGSQIMGVPVLGDGSKLAELRRQGIGLAVNAVGGIGSIAPRLKVYERLRLAGFGFPTVIHPRAFVEPTACLGEGGQIFFNAYVGSDVKVGFGCIINTGAIISHDCFLSDYVNISPGAILAGAVTVNERSLVGMGVTVNLNVTIGAGSRVGNSAVVKADVPENGVVRAGTIWPVDASVG